jgi:hypothetical protein
MTKGLGQDQVKWLTYLVYLLITILTVITGWHTVTIANMPKEYVRLERYQCDTRRVEKKMDKLGGKLDRLFEGQPWNSARSAISP